MYEMITLSYQYKTDIQTILSSFSFPSTPYRRVASQGKPWGYQPNFKRVLPQQLAVVLAIIDVYV